jgi:hypothetical protein
MVGPSWQGAKAAPGIEAAGIGFSYPGLQIPKRVQKLIWGGASVQFVSTLNTERQYTCLASDPEGLSASPDANCARQKGDRG